MQCLACLRLCGLGEARANLALDGPEAAALFTLLLPRRRSFTSWVRANGIELALLPEQTAFVVPLPLSGRAGGESSDLGGQTSVGRVGRGRECLCDPLPSACTRPEVSTFLETSRGLRSLPFSLALIRQSGR